MNTQCTTGTCGTFYADNDGDTFGAGPAIRRCGATAPAGFATSNSDCCDSDLRAHPGQTAYSPDPRNAACGANNFDYDCNGANDAEPLGTGECQPPPAPACNQCAGGLGWAKPVVPACGALDDQVTSVGGGASGSCSYTQAMLMMVRAKCR